MKYIILERDGPIVFGEHLTHNSIADKLGKTQRVIGAGFVDFGVKSLSQIVKVYGKAISLYMEAKAEDLEEIERVMQ